ncbi:MAG: hypothetical protein V1903_09030 [Bacteroidota bacterium]
MLISVFLNYNRFRVSLPGKITILVYGLLFSSPALSSQNIKPPENSHIIGFNIGSNQVKENILIPKAHIGSSLSVTYEFEKESNNFHALNFNLGYSRLKTKLETDKVTWNGQIDAGYSWGKSLISVEKIKYSLGVNLSYILTVMEYPVWDESRAYWGTAFSAGPFTRLKMTFNNNGSWISSLSLDLLGLSSRPDELRLYAQEEWTLSNILRITNSGYSFGTADRTFLCVLKNEYRIPFKDDNFLSVNNSITYATISEYRSPSLQTIRIDFGVGLGF